MFYTAQIVFGLWAIGFAHFQSPCIKAMGDYVPMRNPYEKPFHNRGALLSFCIGLGVGLLHFYFTKDWIASGILIPLFYAIYKLLFDGVIGIEVYQDFFYVGTTSKQDNWIKERMTGKIKAIICVIVIIVLNWLI